MIVECKNNKPKIILDYNKNNGGVDAFDQKISGLSCKRKTARLTMNCFFFFIDLAVSNSFVNFKENSQRLEHLRFKDSIAAYMQLLVYELAHVCNSERKL
jgi:hypothetical protein